MSSDLIQNNARPADEKDNDRTKTLEDVKLEFAEFLNSNPLSQVDFFSKERQETFKINSLWGDSSISLQIPEKSNKLSQCLNNLYLPERYSAIYHKDTCELEIIFTARPLGEHLSDILQRKFIFQHRGKDYFCEFKLSSARLMEIAEHAFAVGQSTTKYRNLESFFDYAEHIAKPADVRGGASNVGEPISFWINNVLWDENDILSLTSELNFYMTYYDGKSPAIILHSPLLESPKAQNRYRDGKFPKHIRSKELDVNLMRFWMAARGADPAAVFLYNYRIIEYATFFYLESGARNSIKRILASPNALDDVDALMEGVLSIINSTSGEANQKIEGLLREVISPSFLWKHMSENIEVFREKILFDGGFLLEPILKEKIGEKEFNPNAIPLFSKKIRDLRNALSHGRDQRTTLVIAPTAHNFQKLQPWASLIVAVSGEVILYKDSK